MSGFVWLIMDRQMTVFKRLPGEEVIKGKEYIPVKFIKPQLTPETKRVLYSVRCRGVGV